MASSAPRAVESRIDSVWGDMGLTTPTKSRRSHQPTLALRHWRAPSDLWEPGCGSAATPSVASACSPGALPAVRASGRPPCAISRRTMLRPGRCRQTPDTLEHRPAALRRRPGLRHGQPDPGRLLAPGHVQRRHRSAQRRQPAPVRRCPGRRRRHVHQQPDRHLCAGDRRRFRPHLPGTNAAGRPVRADAGGRAAGAGPRPGAALDRRLRQRAATPGAPAAADAGLRRGAVAAARAAGCGRLGVQLGVRTQERVATLRIGAGAGWRARPRPGSASCSSCPPTATPSR